MEKVSGKENVTGTCCLCSKHFQGQMNYCDDVCNKLLSGIQNTVSTIEMRDSLKAQYGAATNASKVNLLTSVNTCIDYDEHLDDIIADLEFYFDKLPNMGLAVVEEMQVAILLLSFMHDETLKGTVVALKNFARG